MFETLRSAVVMPMVKRWLRTSDTVPFRPDQVAGRSGTGRTYEHWATLIAPAVAGALDEHQKVSR